MKARMVGMERIVERFSKSLHRGTRIRGDDPQITQISQIEEESAKSADKYSYPRQSPDIMNVMLPVTPTPAFARIVSVTVTDDTLAVGLEDGRSIAVPIGWYPRLSHAMAEDRANFVISGAGYGIHWPDLDEDIGVEGMLLGKKSTESPQSLARWLGGQRGILSFLGQSL